MKDFTITKGRTDTVVAKITGVDDWTGILAKLFAIDSNKELIFEESGTIDDVEDKITFTLDYTETSALEESSLQYEIILYKDDYSFVKTALQGAIKINTPYKIDPVTT